MARWCGVTLLCLAAVACAQAAEKTRLQSNKKTRTAELAPAQQAEVDDMVNNLLQWIQGLYQQKNRKARQYLSGKPEKPRPFEPATYLPPTGYPAAGSRPTPAYSEGPTNTYQPSYQPSQQPTYQPSQPPTYQPSQQPSYQPSQQPTYQPSQSPTYQPSQQPSYQPSYTPSQSTPSQPPYKPSQQPSYQPSQQPSYQPSQPTQTPFQPSQQPTYQPSQPSYEPSVPTQPEEPTQPDEPSLPTKPDDTTLPPYEQPQQTTSGSFSTGSVNVQVDNNAVATGDDDARHPPHIHAITVDCGKEMMTINIEFNKVYNGLIYSQDHYNEPACVYVKENSNQIKYSFTVSLNSCGTRFFSDFENEGQAYLENVLVLQNEAGIQEVWDHIRRVRCLWEGNLTKQLVSSLSVGMLNQITSNFSGDTAMARLDIQIGRGPFAPEANGLVKIGEIMTLVVTVTGDPGFDILVRECVARDSESRHVVPLTDNDGCILKPKLFGAFQKTRETGNTGASIIAFAYFNAFKFPDEMDLIIQCDVELCKTDCEVCPNPGSIEPRKRRRRDVIHVGNRTMEAVPTTIGKGIRVVFPEELPAVSGVCVSQSAAVWGGLLVLAAALASSALTSYCWQKSRSSGKMP